MLLNGFNHVALLTGDTDRLHSFYREVFDAEIEEQEQGGPGVRLSFIRVGETAERVNW